MDFSPQQQEALRAVESWLNNKRGPQVFRLFGFAGAGKTTLAIHLANNRSNVLFGAYTGRAALIMREKGCYGAATLHSLIYTIDYLDKTTGEPVFKLNPNSPLVDANLIIVDEVSMVNEQLGNDLLSFNTKVLVLGDPFQLPPVKGTGFFTADEPDILLTEIHRQALGNPIVKMSIDIREGYGLKYGTFGESRVLRSSEVEFDDMNSADIVITGKNDTRHLLNDRIRDIRGLPHQQPIQGDRIICLKNDHDIGILNGQIFNIDEVETKPAHNLTLRITPVDGGHSTKIKTNLGFFNGESDKWDWRKKRNFNEFDFGYAITTHKAQGGQWDHVFLIDESGVFRDDAQRWLYTAVTRAAEKITVMY